MIDGYWLRVMDGDPRARALFQRHYSAKESVKARRQAIGNDAKFAGIGENLVLLTQNCDALFVWRAERVRHDGQDGINCAVFRNESPILASALIAEADEIAWRRWPGERHFTYVHPGKIRSVNPGYCFKQAGWSACGRSKGGLVILERLAEYTTQTPHDMCSEAILRGCPVQTDERALTRRPGHGQGGQTSARWPIR